jgi:hypothetical protein
LFIPSDEPLMEKKKKRRRRRKAYDSSGEQRSRRLYPF